MSLLRTIGCSGDGNLESFSHDRAIIHERRIVRTHLSVDSDDLDSVTISFQVLSKMFAVVHRG